MQASNNWDEANTSAKPSSRGSWRHETPEDIRDGSLATPSVYSESSRSSAAPSATSTSAIELERIIGYSAIPNALHWHPYTQDYVYPVGGAIVLSSAQDIHTQRCLQGHDASISCLAMSSSGTYLASGERGQRADVIVWEYNSGRPFLRLSEHDAGIAALAFSDDERLLASVGIPEDGRLFVWDVQSGQICATHQKLSATISAMTFGGMARDIKRRDTRCYQFATAGHRSLLLWVLDPVTGQLSPSKVEQTVIRDYTCIDFSRDRETLVAGTTSGDFAVVGVKTRRLIKMVPACSGGIYSLQFLPTAPTPEGLLVVGGGDGTVILFDEAYVDASHVTLNGAVFGVAVQPSLHADSSHPARAYDEVVAGTQAGSIYALQLSASSSSKWMQIKTMVGESHAGGVIQVQYPKSISRGGVPSDKFATISKDSTIRIWDASDYTTSVKCVVIDGGAPLCLQFSLDILLSGWTDGTVRCHACDNGQMLWQITDAHVGGGVTALALSHNQRFLVSGGYTGEVRVWDLRKRDLVSHLKEHSMPVTSLALYKDDMHVISCSRDRSILCWDLKLERRVSSHAQRMGGINTVALASGERIVLSAGQEKRISYWDLRIDTPVRVISTAHAAEATCIAVANSLPIFATGGNDRLIKLWDLDSGKLVMDGIGHSGNVRDVHFSPDDRQLVSVGEDGCIIVWNLYTE